jgi:hypothetical protein
MLAAPADGPWVAPETLLARPATRRYDLVAALLRLAPHGRVAGGSGPVAYALGGPPPPRPGLRRRRLDDPALWVAAARARDPFGRDPALAAYGLTGAGRADPLVTRLALHSQPSSHAGRTWWSWTVAVAGEVADAPPDQPTAVTTRAPMFRPDLEDWVGWLATVWPHDAEHALVTLADPALWASYGSEVRHDAVRVLAALAGHPGRLGPLAYATLAAGLSGRAADQRVHAVDAVLALRPDPARLAAAMAETLPLCTPARWAKSLADLAAAGAPGPALATLRALLPLLPPGTRGRGTLEATLREESLRHGLAP